MRKLRLRKDRWTCPGWNQDLNLALQSVSFLFFLPLELRTGVNKAQPVVLLVCFVNKVLLEDTCPFICVLFMASFAQ